MSHLRKSLHLHYLLLFSYQDLKETLNVASQKELTSSLLATFFISGFEGNFKCRISERAYIFRAYTTEVD